MRDLAEAAGVSPMTVSRAFRDDETVSAQTRARVREIADRLGYVYDSTATAFRTQKSGFVAVTLPSINNANFAETYRGLSERMSGSGIQLLLGATGYRIEKEEDLVRQLLTRNPEALVLTGGNHTGETRDLIKARGLPVIEMWDLPVAPLGHAVGFSNVEAMGQIVRHLADTGRRRLAFLGAREGGDLRGSERRRGAEAAAKACDLPDVAFIDAGPAPVSMQHGASAVARLGAGLKEFDALVCVSDPVAFGALSECRRLGVSVPGDLAITGFGNFEVAAVSEPRITTIDVKAREIGETVASVLGDIFAGEGELQRHDLGAALLRGGTS